MQKVVAVQRFDLMNLKKHNLAVWKYWLGERHATSLPNELLVVQHRRVPLQLQEAQQLPHLLLCVKH